MFDSDELFNKYLQVVNSPNMELCGLLEQRWHEGWGIEPLRVAIVLNKVSMSDIVVNCGVEFCEWLRENW